VIEIATLERLHTRFASLDDGEVATYIPELSKANARHFGVSVCDLEGTARQVGDVQVPFTVQSISKPFVYGLALEAHGREAVHARVGVEPSGDAFNSIIELERHSHRPYNPMVNAGAIAVSALVPGASSEERFSRVLEAFSGYAGRTLDVDHSVYQSERSTGHRNLAIAHLLRHFGVISGELDDAVDRYFKQCSVQATAHDLSLFAATLANGGVNPRTGRRMVSREHVRCVLSLMFTCGMYDSAGEWAFTVGLPAKSGVSGGLIVVIPGKLGMATYSPRLDRHGHSVRGVAFFRALAAERDLSLF
jgi:glutaminase